MLTAASRILLCLLPGAQAERPWPPRTMEGLVPGLAVLLLLVAPLPPAVSGGPPAKEPRVVRPVLWWSDLGRISDSGGPAFKPTTRLITDARGFAKAWEQLGRPSGRMPNLSAIPPCDCIRKPLHSNYPRLS
jgi:hypothetical protein